MCYTEYMAEIGMAADGAPAAAVAFVVLCGVFLFMRVVLLVRLRAIAERTTPRADDLIVAALASVSPSVFIVLAAFVAVQFLALPHNVRVGTIVVIVLLVTYHITRAIRAVSAAVAARLRAAHSGKEYHMRAALSLLSGIVVALVWVGSALVVLANLGVDVTAFVTGLGIGGIAVALALQGILKDLFASFSIFFDRPFTIDDFIEVGAHSGTVQRIGVKTTRLRALSGEEIVIPNQDLTATTVRNFRRMRKRRVTQHLAVAYETPHNVLQEIPAMLMDIIAAQEHVTPLRAHLKSLGESAVEYEYVYTIDSRDYSIYMDVRQAINLAILAACAARGITIAYPTQTVYHAPLQRDVVS